MEKTVYESNVPRVYTLYRVSTIGQVEKDDIPMQKQVCRDFAKKQGWVVVKEFSEKGISVWRLSLSAKELISSDALIFLRRNGGEVMKYECLKLEERRIIEEMYAKGAKPGEIAERVGKCQATIYRELERGKTGETDSRFRQGYSAAVAEARVNRSYRNRGRRKAAQ